ncbi:hypothetical protein ACSYAD_30065 [Acaryochloris marina NIES-2412]|uniref:hypothetical protein n=1 Tax=Acaryochloris marina TaxID=155978 RepID=UPI0040587DB3
MTAATPDNTPNFQSWVEQTIAGMLSIQKEIQESQIKNSQDIAELRKITSDLVGYSINQESDIQIVREDLQALKRRVDAIDEMG